MNNMSLPEPIRSAFYTTVWKIVGSIPTGKVATYGQIAALIPIPHGVLPEHFKAFGARWVGSAMAACPSGVPWQRVINSQGKISSRQGAEVQRKLLEAEGVVFDSHERVDLKKFGWSGPEE